ncbi:MAG: sulfatase-like hydrolase/transferase, partial [Planctomycetes bacterium]|nr:sulfatase-like hydrolase/transferase [Planctomycetota bacterium]
MRSMRWRLLLVFLIAGCGLNAESAQSKAAAPNVIVIMTDDQGWGDFGFHGNPVLQTPALDGFAASATRLNTFYVHPVCTPTRSALMTGRYPQRTRAFDTWVGRAMMDPQEVTVAEVLRGSGWATGIFGKWHLGDCYPMRAMDQGFDESLVHLGGGIGQPADPEGGEGKYTDPILFHNGEAQQMDGYCTDIYFDEALAWITEQSQKDKPFFAYIPTNAPHGPFHDVPEQLLKKYQEMDLAPAFAQPQGGHSLPKDFNADRLARIFAMIENVDQNV